MLPWVYDDGGRQEAGFKGTADDCTVRAIVIATEIPYDQVYRDLKNRMGTGHSPRNSVHKTIYKPYLEDLGWQWTATMAIGTGCRVHLTQDELPSGRLICRLSKHLVAVIDGTIRDTHDCSRSGRRCVYGYFTPKEEQP